MERLYVNPKTRKVERHLVKADGKPVWLMNISVPEPVISRCTTPGDMQASGAMPLLGAKEALKDEGRKFQKPYPIGHRIIPDNIQSTQVNPQRHRLVLNTGYNRMALFPPSPPSLFSVSAKGYQSPLSQSQ